MSAFDSADGRALYRAVCAAPDDDLPRLVLADYLEERARDGDRDRAAFIRAQCEQARTVWMTARWRKLDRAAEKLRLANLGAWSDVVAGVGRHPAFVRGFVDSVQLLTGAFVTRGAGLLDAAPVREVRLIDATAGHVPVPEFLAAPPTVRLRAIDFGTVGLGVDGFAALASAALPGLESVAVSAWHPAADMLPAVAANLPALARVRVPAGAALPLVRVPAFRRVRELDLGRWAASEAVAGLAASPHAAGLARLTLKLDADLDRDTYANYVLTADAVHALTTSSHLAGLVRLDLAGSLGRPRAAAAAVGMLAATPTLGSLQVLDLSGHALTDAAVRRLAGAAFAPTLKVLVVRRCGLAKANAKRFAGVFPHAEVVV